ncbi:MAG: UDP-N-acetylmuramoyl-L-alanine--D-glutamate ligase [Saprospiraceae bacterium]|nr:UDP-N-acetylmuramoyl-L-alanine--D-glutamate ligase [Saprospiraceae bacterium]
MKKRIAILGSGESGTGAALLAQHAGYDVFVSDKGGIKDQYKRELDAHGIAWEENRHSLDQILNAAEIIKSPGIPEKSEVMQAVRAKGINVIGEIEFGYRYAGKCRIVAITGSNGKTTTTELTFHLLKTAGLNVRMGGNVGNSFARMALDDLKSGQSKNGERVFVLEVSSFQLDDIQQFRPKIAVLLNITPDHLDRYDYKLENYARSKFRVMMNQKRGDVFIFNGFDPVISSHGVTQSHPVTNSHPKRVAIRKGFFKNGHIRVGKTNDFDLTRGHLRGPHNMFNAVCAIRTALLLGADPAKIQRGLDSFVPPPHRLEKVAVVNGVTYINDSKATNVDSVFYALQAMETPTVWIVGGQDKGNDYSPLLPLVRKKVKAIVCMGIDNSKIISVFKNHKKPMTETRSAEEAVNAAAGFAEKGDTVLLSPACASFDLFKNYEDRGEQFREAVLKMVKTA